MMMRVSFLYLLIIFVFSELGISYAQFPPQYPHAGHDAIAHTDSRIIDWASNCTVVRGYMDILDHSLGLAESGNEANATGTPDGMTVSLGDGGHAIIEFDIPIINGEGPDFAVFENAFANPLNNEVAFLELAHVEVSNDGITYFRFPSVCLLEVDTQNTNNTYADARFIHNLAGKYIRNQGTPFDLEDMKDEEGLDVNNIKFIKIIDVIGIINDENYTSYDSEGNMINDPYPTPFPTGGFDLDAVGVLNNQSSTSADSWVLHDDIRLFPNPVQEILYIEIQRIIPPSDIGIYNVSGQRIDHIINASAHRPYQFTIHTNDLTPGVYFIKFKNIVKSFLKQ